MSYTTGPTLRIENENKDVTPAHILSIADGLWKWVRKSTLDAEKLMIEARRLQPDFCTSYPIVLRYMCQMREYNHRAFERYLAKIGQHPWTTEAEYLDSQVDYIVLLYKAQHRHYTQTQIDNLRTNMRVQLHDEHEEFKRQHAEAQHSVEADEEMHLQQNRDELRRWFSACGGDVTPTIRAESDLPTTEAGPPAALCVSSCDSATVVEQPNRGVAAFGAADLLT